MTGSGNSAGGSEGLDPGPEAGPHLELQGLAPEPWESWLAGLRAWRGAFSCPPCIRTWRTRASTSASGSPPVRTPATGAAMGAWPLRQIQRDRLGIPPKVQALRTLARGTGCCMVGVSVLGWFRALLPLSARSLFRTRQETSFFLENRPRVHFLATVCRPVGRGATAAKRPRKQESAVWACDRGLRSEPWISWTRIEVAPSRVQNLGVPRPCATSSAHQAESRRAVQLELPK